MAGVGHVVTWYVLSMPSRPGFGERETSSSQLGVIHQGRPAIRDRVVSAWNDFIAVARETDLSAKTRLPGWRAHEVCTHLGAWDDYEPVNGVLEAARQALSGAAPEGPRDPDDANSWVVQSHRDASRDDVIGALERARDSAAAYLDSPEPDELDEVMVVSTVGPLPALTIIHAQIYELAVHSLDLKAAGGPEPPGSLLDGGLAALTDTTGALAARVGISSLAGIRSDVGAWAFCSGESGWQIGRWSEPASKQARPAPNGDAASARRSFEGKLPVRIDAPAETLLEASAGRINPLRTVATRRIKVSGLPGLLGLAPIVEKVPGIPGGTALRVAAKGLAGAGGALGRLTRR